MRKNNLLKKVVAVFLVLVLSAGLINVPFINPIEVYAAYSEDVFFSEYIGGSEFEKNTAARMPAYFNAGNNDIELDSRSGTLSVFEVKEDSQVSSLTIEEARAKPLNEVVTVEGIVTGNGSKAFIQDDTAAINLYSQKDSVEFNEGDKIRVTGSVIEYNGLLEIANYTVDEIISTGNPIPVAALTIDQIGEDNESEKIKLEGVKIGAINTSGSTILTDTLNRTIAIYRIPALTGIFEGDLVDVTGFVTEFRGTYQIHVNNSSDVVKSQSQPSLMEPVFYGMDPQKAETTYELRPQISISYEEGAKSLQTSTIELKIDNALVTAQSTFDGDTKTGTVTYIPESDLSIGEHEVSFTIKDEENKEYVKNWYFTIIENKADYNTYFGIPHAHTSFSDGQGTPSLAYEHAYNNGLDFLIITDHSNQLDGDNFDSKNNQFVPALGSEWETTKEMADQFNSQHQGEFLAMRGFEWTHSSMGHLNALNSINYTEAKKTMTKLGDFYDWLQKEDVVGAFNHPNWPGDSFNNLAYDEDADRFIKLIEAGNGAPPYSYSRSIEHYYKALDNGWHVGAVNAQDNHSENWGDPDNLTGVMAEELTVGSFTEAIKAHRVYSTETRDLVLKMKANGYWMGSVIDLNQGESLAFDIFAEDSSDPIERMELITNRGKTIATTIVNSASATWTPEITPVSGSNWYVVKVIHQNGKLGISSPIWTTGGENDLKLTELTIDPQPALPGVTSSIQATITNFGARSVNNVEVKFYHTNDQEENLIGTYVLTSVSPDNNMTAHVNWAPSVSGETSIIAKLTEIPGVTTVTELSKTILVVTPINKKVLIDQYHGNADVPGTVGDFIKLLRTYGYEAELNNQPITESVLTGIDVMVLGAPSETKELSADENIAIANWVRGGGAILVADKSNYSYNNMLLNPVMEAMGSGIRFNDDNVYELEDSEKYSGGMVWSIYMETFPYAPSGLNKNMKSLRIFSGCSLINEDGGALVNNPESGLEILLAANNTSYNYAVGANTGNGYMYNEKGSLSGETIPILAKEEIGNGKVIAAGRHFYSDYEIVNDVSNTSFTLNVIDWLAGYDRIKDISWVRENAVPGVPYTVKGIITAPTNLFYDSMYIEDETGGICLYGSQKAEFRLGEEVIATGVLKEFEGEKELCYQDFTNDVLYIGPAGDVEPIVITTKDVADGSYAGSLVSTEGNVVEVNKPASYFKVDDGLGAAYIHVDGYLGIDIDTLKAGDSVKVTGIASMGAAGPRIRVRYLSDIVKNELSEKHIIIVHTNDTHGRVKAGRGSMGFARINTKIKELKANNPESVLVLDAGDTLHGQTILSISKGESMVRIMNKIGYDAMAAGNHDFNYGQERLQELDALSDFLILAANVLKSDGTPLLTPYIIKEVNGVKVAIFGLATPETLYKTHPKNVEGLTFVDPVEAAKGMVDELKDNADVIIALTHLGLDEGSSVKSSDVAAGVSGVDLIVDGHSHSAITEGTVVNGTMIVQAGEYDKYLGIVDVKVGTDGSVSCSPELLSATESATIVEDKEILDLISQIEEENSLITSEVVGTTEVVLDGERTHVRSNETNLGNLIADAMKETANADIALTNGGGIRASIDVGEITKGEAITVLPFGNIVVLKEVSGADVLAALENGFSKYPAYDGRFPNISGMRVVFDATKPAGSRVTQVTVGGEPLDVNKTYRLATNDFIAAGGDEYTVLADDSIIGEFATLDEVLVEYIKKHGTPGAKKDGRVKAIAGAKIAVFADPHYFSPELGTEGPAFMAYLAKDRKLIAESSFITKATVDEIKATEAEIVLICGDLTKDGEKLSHEHFAAVIAELEAAGKKVYVASGNHDINNPQANSYLGEEPARVENVTSEEFKTIYNDFGYEEAISKDPNSLAYVVEPVPGLWVISMDACQYDENDTKDHSETGGRFSEERMEWIRQQLSEAEAQGKIVIGFMHQGIVEHYNGQKQLFTDFVIENWEEVSEELADLGMKAVFTGHYHSQDIVSKTTAKGNTIYDIETGSLVTYPCPYRVVDLSTKGMDVSTHRITSIDYDTGDMTFQEYARHFLKTGLEGLVPYMLVGQLMAMNPQMTQEEAYVKALEIANTQPALALTSMTIKDILVDAFMQHYQGDEKALPEVMAVVQGMASSTDPMTKMLGSVLVSMYTDLPPQDNNIVISFDTTLTVGSKVTNPGKDVAVKLTMNNLLSLAGLKVKLTYDPGKLSVKNVSLSPLLGEAYAINTTVPGEIQFNAVNSNGITMNSLDIANITFSVNEECPIGDTEINIVSVESCDNDTKGINVKSRDGIITVEEAVLPTTENVTFTGEAVVGQVLTAHYDYFDAKNRLESGTTFRWLKAEHGTENYVEIEGALSNTLVVTEDLAGKDIIVEVTPANAENKGIAITGHNDRNMVISLGDVSKDGTLNFIDAMLVLRSITGKITLDSQATKAADVNGADGINVNDVVKILRKDVGLDLVD